MPPPLQHSHICTDMTLTFDLWPWKHFSAIPPYMMNICGMFHRNLSCKQRNITPREIRVNGRTTDGWPKNIMPPPLSYTARQPQASRGGELQNVWRWGAETHNAANIRTAHCWCYESTWKFRTDRDTSETATCLCVDACEEAALWLSPWTVMDWLTSSSLWDSHYTDRFNSWLIAYRTSFGRRSRRRTSAVDCGETWATMIVYMAE